MLFFVKYPPVGDNDAAPKGSHWSPYAYVLEEHADTEKALHQLSYMYDLHRNPLYALDAVSRAHRARVYPPLWALEVIVDRYQRAMKTDGSLDRAFGLTSKGMGKGKRPNSLALHKQMVRDSAFCLVVLHLQALGMTRPAACKALSELLNRLSSKQYLQPPGMTFRLKRMSISGRQIQNAVDGIDYQFQSEWRRLQESAKLWSLDQKRSALRFFFPNELPVKLVKELGLA